MNTLEIQCDAVTDGLSATALSAALAEDPIAFPAACVHQLFEVQAARSPEAVAVVFGAEQLSYRQLNERANHLAHYLRRRGVGPESLVGIGLRRSPWMVAALLGVWKAGGAYLPLDPAYPRERLSFMVEDANVRLVLTDEATHPLFAPIAAKIAGHEDGQAVTYLNLQAESAAIAEESADNPPSTVVPANLAYLMYTSGSTGRPKGAMVTHAGLANYVAWAAEAYAIAPGGSVPVHSSLSFDLTVTSLYPPLLAGAQVELLPEAQGVEALLAALRMRKRSLVKITPAHLELLNQQLAPEELANLTDAFIIGGENLTAERLENWRRHAPATRLINEYGPTETVVGCCIHELRPEEPHTGSVPIGRPIANTRLYVLDTEQRPVAPGEVGELYIGGVGVARGYWNRSALTAERFIPDPFSARSGARLYRTGDLARQRADGVFEYLGRCDNQVKVRGYRIELGEIETVLAGHPQVRACAVLAEENQHGDKALVAFAVSADGSALEEGALVDFLRQRLPDYMVPDRVLQLDALPLTSNGKVDRHALSRIAATPRPRPDSATPQPLRTPTERMVMSLFQDILKRTDIAVDQDFFDLGGRSLMAMRLITQLRAGTGIDLPQRTLYEHPTVARLAAAIDAHFWAAAPGSGGNPGHERDEFTL